MDAEQQFRHRLAQHRLAGAVGRHQQVDAARRRVQLHVLRGEVAVRCSRPSGAGASALSPAATAPGPGRARTSSGGMSPAAARTAGWLRRRAPRAGASTRPSMWRHSSRARSVIGGVGSDSTERSSVAAASDPARHSARSIAGRGSRPPPSRATDLLAQAQAGDLGPDAAPAWRTGSRISSACSGRGARAAPRARPAGGRPPTRPRPTARRRAPRAPIASRSAASVRSTEHARPAHHVQRAVLRGEAAGPARAPGWRPSRPPR